MFIRTNRFRASLLCGAATSLALVAVAQPALAQDTPPDDETTVEELVITGIRAGLENSISVKREESSIVEVVSAEDIGRLPDVSIAESIARLPGITAQRLNGRAQVISVRGLSPDFTTALLNGREQVTAGDARGVEFDQYPSELLSGVVIYKTPDASLIGQGLAGTADLRTIRPLEFGRRALALGARYEWNDIGALNAGTDEDGYRYNISFVDQFFDDRVGVALGYASMSSPYQAERFNAWGYPTVGGHPADPDPVVIGGAKPYVQSSLLERDGYFATFEFRPNEQVRSTVDAFYSEFAFEEVLRGIELPLYWSSATLQPGSVAQNGLVVQGQFNGVKGVVRNDVNTRDSELFAIGWNTQFTINDFWSAELDLSHSSISREDVILETYSGTGRAGFGATDNMGFTTGPSGTRFTSTLNYADFNTIRLTSPQGWGGDVIPGGQAGYFNSPSIEDELNAIRLSAERYIGGTWLDSIEFGVNYTDREKSLTANEWFLGLSASDVVVPESARRGITSLDFLGIPGMISYDPFALLSAGVYTLVRNPNGDVAAKNWNVEETVTTFYTQFNIDMPLSGTQGVTGNFGVQVVQTEQASQGFAATGSGATTISVPVDESHDYVEVLPSLNLTVALSDQDFLRLGAARTLARPRLDDMRASFTYNYDESRRLSSNLDFSPWSGGGGNPFLEPWIARSFDIAYEHYFGGRGYISIAAYYKDLETYIYNQRRLADFTGFPVGPAGEPLLRQGFVSNPANGEGGSIAGVEVAFNAPLDIFHPALDGFGVFMSASMTDSQIEPNGPGSGFTPLPGLSEEVINTTLYYERNGLQARISSRYRSDFLGEVAVFANGRGLRMVDAENVIDAQLGYTFDIGPLSGLGVTLQVNNLTDEEFSTYQDSEDRVIDYQRYGRTFLLGVNWRY
ncbi:TonB-dependent receptor [Brevundimonas sp.]|uniref:TonB-dependent receptor n=1 Tax=Brevundimonas sp. TaxID=1871086 RepID=UPI0025EAC1C4|nr:TonB-dependent receptor [Brevundimonas sp.]